MLNVDGVLVLTLIQLNIIVETPEMQPQLVSSHGMLAILEVLEGRASRDVTLKLLQIVNELVTTDRGFLESFCLIGYVVFTITSAGVC